MASVRQIANQTGVSITTVSRVLNNHPLVSDSVRRKVLRAVAGSRYVAKVGKRSTSNIALLYTGEWSLGSPFDAALMHGMAQPLSEFGYDLLILNARRSLRPGETYSQMLFRKGVQGAVVRTTADSRADCLRLAEEGFPSVVVADEFTEPHVSWVCTDARNACRQGLEQLIHAGHRRIAITLNVVDDHDHRQRFACYQEALAAAGIALDDRLVLRVAAYRDAGIQALRQLLGLRDRPTAVFVTDPLVALGLLQEAARTGLKIPVDLSVLGFDDREMRFETFPRMSAICQNAEAIGREALLVLQQLITQPVTSRAQQRRLDCWLELQDSTGVPAGPQVNA